jgi:hypothetical protein
MFGLFILLNKFAQIATLLKRNVKSQTRAVALANKWTRRVRVPIYLLIRPLDKRYDLRIKASRIKRLVYPADRLAGCDSVARRDLVQASTYLCLKRYRHISALAFVA